MKILIDRSFEKDTDKLMDQKLLQSIAECIEGILNADKLSDISNCKKLKGSRHAYRIRIGDYRIGFILEKQTIELIRFLHRSVIYNYFPK